MDCGGEGGGGGGGSIQIDDWSISILDLMGKPQNNYLYKTALSRRLLT